MNINVLIESILFFKAEPVSLADLANILGTEKSAIVVAVAELTETLSKRGVRLIIKDDSVLIVTAPEASQIIEKMRRDEIERELSSAALETLSTILYLGPIAKSEIDYIRGVNTGFMLRNLSIRGLVEKIPNPADHRAFLYRASFDLLQNLGIENLESLPHYQETIESINRLRENRDEENESNQQA